MRVLFYSAVLFLFCAGASVNAQQSNDRVTDFHWAAVIGDMNTVVAFIDTGADVNVQIGGGSTALMRAAFKGHTEIVKVLIDAGADVNVQNKDGNTALIWATLKGRTEIVKVLIDAEASH